jgi:hypothetical protein
MMQFRLRHVTRKDWLKRQLNTCGQLLSKSTLNDIERDIVVALRKEFREELMILKRRKDDGDSNGCC